MRLRPFAEPLSEAPTVSVVIPNLDGAHWLEACLPTIAHQTLPPLETIIVDNGSRENAPALVHSQPAVRWLQLGRNHGFAGAANAGAATASGTFLFFLNNDTRLERDAVEHLVDALERTGGAIAAPTITPYDGNTAGLCGVGVDVFGYPRPVEPGSPPFYADGAALVVRRAVFEALGGFDASYFLFYEETDLAWRALLSGHDVVCAPEAVVRHFGGGTLAGGRARGEIRTSATRRYFGERNRLTTLLKNCEARTLLWLLPAYLLITGAAALALMLGGRLGLAVAYPRALAWNLRMLRQTLRKRRAVQAARTRTDAELRRRMHWGSEELALFRRHGLPRSA